jgi:hypothetical protein
MEPMIAVCGLACHECGAFIATKDDDDEKRAEVAQQWSKEYSTDIKPEDIHCEGCLSDEENVFSYCKVCEIRKCGRENEVVNCAHCSDYTCERLDKFFQMVPDCKERLDEIHIGL